MGIVKIYFGPMRSGKTTSMYRDVERQQYAKKLCVIVKYNRDNRFDEFGVLVNHSRENLNKVPIMGCGSNLDAIYEELAEYDIIGIDEAQFYVDLPEVVLKLAKLGKSVIMSGLDSDFRGKPFGRIAEVIPVCDQVEKLAAVCKCGHDALYTKRITNDETLEVIGDDIYVSVCRGCFWGVN